MMLIREFVLAEYDAVYTLWQACGPGVHTGRSDTREEIAKKLERDPDLFLVAVEGDAPASGWPASGRIIGTVIGGFDGRRGIIYHLAVDPAYRGQGIGKMLMQAVEQRLAAKGCLRCYLLVERGNENVVDFYRRLDWEIMDLTIMVKTLS